MPDPRPHRLKTAIGLVASLLIAGLATWVLYRTFQRIEPADVLRKMTEVPRAKLLLAAACALGGFLAIALYEGVVVRHVKRPLGVGKPALTALSYVRDRCVELRQPEPLHGQVPRGLAGEGARILERPLRLDLLHFLTQEQIANDRHTCAQCRRRLDRAEAVE